jgi:uncharacterized surface protein with fasciclin (FAS1) repeats
MKKILSVLFLSFILLNCSDNEDIAPPAPLETITQIIDKNPDLSSLAAAIKKAELTKTFDESGTYTLFAPINSAFTAFLAEKNFSKLEDVPNEELKQLLLNHVLPKKILKKGLATLKYENTLAAFADSKDRTLSMFINTDAEEIVRINGVKESGASIVTDPNIEGLNGVIHKVDKVIDLPTISMHIKANPDFDTLESALTRSENTTDFIKILSESTFHTLFAPKNSAFDEFFKDFTLSLPEIPEPVLDRTLKYHVIEGFVLSKDLPANETIINTLAGAQPENSFTFLSNPNRLKDSRNRESAIDTKEFDIQCTNGVIHVLEKVLYPSEAK